MVKLDKIRAGIIDGNAQAFEWARHALANPNTTAYKRRVLTELLATHALPAGVEPIATTVAPAPAVAAPVAQAPEAAQATRWILQAAGVPDAVIEAALACLAPVSVTLPAPASAPVDEQAVSEDNDPGDLVIEDDPVLKEFRREARRLAVEQYDVRVLKLGKPISFSQYIRGSVGRQAFEENLRELMLADVGE